MAQETLQADDADRCVKLASEVVAVEGLAALVVNVDDPGDGKVVAGHTLRLDLKNQRLFPPHGG